MVYMHSYLFYSIYVSTKDIGRKKSIFLNTFYESVIHIHKNGHFRELCCKILNVLSINNINPFIKHDHPFIKYDDPVTKHTISSIFLSNLNLY